MIFKDKNNSGFTLLELMIGAAILIVALVGLISAYTNCLTLNDDARSLTLAIIGAQEKMEYIQSLSFGDIANQDGVRFEISGLRNDDSEGIIEVESVTPNLFRITVTVCWQQKGGRVFGEDNNLNGTLDAGEDDDGDGRLDSPAQLVTLIQGGKL